MNSAAGSTLVALLLAGFAAPARAQNPSVPVTLTRIDLAVSIDYPERTLAGTASIHIRNHKPQPALRIPLQTNRLMSVSAVTNAQGAPLHFSQDVVRYTDWPSRQMNQVWVDLARPLAPGDSTTLGVAWDGYLTPATETGMLYVRESIDSAFTMLRWESGGFPFLGVPSQAANRAAPMPEFDFSARITVPKYQVVATGGALISRTEHDSTVTYEYRSIKPTPMLNIGIAPYRVIDDGIRMSYFPQDSAGAEALLDAGRRAMTRMAEWFGPMDSSIKPHIIEIGDGYGSQAALAGGIFQQASGFRGKEGFGELYHELSHLWNPPTSILNGSRWNEGLAMFLQGLLMEQLDGWPNRKTWTEGYVGRFVQQHRQDSLVTRVPLMDYGRRGSTNNSYSVGNFMFDVLYETLGPAEFNRVLGGFYQKYRTSGATDQQFADYVKQQAKYDLTGFFRDWFFTTKWYDRVSGGETLQAMALTYRVAKVS